ncbi:lipase [Mycena maculata]|uniref:Lipase n=1 Tax=Mycena maculata TaxID=230809 RepID=A0AAD7NYC7_9AGAR|nr:lipase [Mycena maculata]
MVRLGQVGLLILALVAFVVVLGHSTPLSSANQTIVPLSLSQVATYRPYTYFAATGYCPANFTLSWSCGVNCLGNADFKPVASGGDGEFSQYWFVGYSPSLKRVIVSHQGTQFSDVVSIIEDAAIIQTPLDPVLFPGIDPNISVHCGFADEHARTATLVLAAVKTALAEYDTSTITAVAHSLGGAIALLDGVYLPLHLSATVKVNVVAYGLPRVGNQAFANYVDAHLSLTHINNRKDVVPIIPGMDLDYHHPSGEVHIQESGEWDSCPGQDNESNLCSTGAVPSVLDGSIADHDGPYDGVLTSCSYLTNA